MSDLNTRIRRVVDRSKRFYEADESGHFLVGVKFEVQQGKSRALNAYDLENDLEELLDCQLAAKRRAWAAKECLDDDTIPSICPWFGYAEHSAWLGGRVRLQPDTSLLEPFVRTAEDLDKLVLSEDNQWFGYMKRGYEYLRSQCQGDYALAVRGLASPMELANSIRGDELLTDFLLEPDFVHQMLERLTDALIWYWGHLSSWADTIEDGHVMMSSNWIGPDGLGHFSNDTAMLCSPDVYEEFGYPYESRIVKQFKRTMYHIHNQNMHFVKRLCELPTQVMAEITVDPKTPKICEDLERVLGAATSLHVMLHLCSDDVRKYIDKLKCRNVYLDVNCKDVEDAANIIEFVRGHSKQLD